MASCLRSCRKRGCQHSESKHRIPTVLAISSDVVRFRFADRITHNPCASHSFARSRIHAWVFQSAPACSDVYGTVTTVLFRFGARRSWSPGSTKRPQLKTRASSAASSTCSILIPSRDRSVWTTAASCTPYWLHYFPFVLQPL